MYGKKKCVFCGRVHLCRYNEDGSITCHDNDDKKLPNSQGMGRIMP